MAQSDSNSQPEQEKFISPRSKYYGDFTPENLAFDANLQDFAQRVNIICALETGGKITSTDAYEGIRKAWKELKHSKKGLEIGKDE